MLRITAVKLELHNSRIELVDSLAELIGEYRSAAALFEKLKSLSILPMNRVIHYSKAGYHVLKWISKDGDIVIENTRVLYVESRNRVLQDCWLKLRLPIVMLYKSGCDPVEKFTRVHYMICPTDQHTISSAASISPTKHWGLIPVNLLGGLGTAYVLRALRSKTFASSGFFGPNSQDLVDRIYGWSPSGSSAMCLAAEETENMIGITFRKVSLKTVRVGEPHGALKFNLLVISKKDFQFLGLAEKVIDGKTHLCYMLQSVNTGKIHIGELSRQNPSALRHYPSQPMLPKDINTLRNYIVV